MSAAETSTDLVGIPSGKLDQFQTELSEIRKMVSEQKTCEVLTREEAIAYVKAKNGRAFDAWRAKWHVKPCGYRRYSRCALDLALAREAGLVRVPASIRRAS